VRHKFFAPSATALSSISQLIWGFKNRRLLIDVFFSCQNPLGGLLWPCLVSVFFQKLYHIREHVWSRCFCPKRTQKLPMFLCVNKVRQIQRMLFSSSQTYLWETYVPSALFFPSSEHEKSCSSPSTKFNPTSLCSSVLSKQPDISLMFRLCSSVQTLLRTKHVSPSIPKYFNARQCPWSCLFPKSLSQGLMPLVPSPGQNSYGRSYVLSCVGET
jgi:hypothetical protein